MVWSTDEETGSATSRALIEDEARKSEAVLVLEPALANGALKTARKGIAEYELTVHGVSAHAGVDPRKGVNAIRELALQVVALDRLVVSPQGMDQADARKDLRLDRAARFSSAGGAEVPRLVERGRRPIGQRFS